jgi:hypothetical protein
MGTGGCCFKPLPDYERDYLPQYDLELRKTAVRLAAEKGSDE